jgi:Putative auto-transporter adhesin, head GIN domain
MARFLIVSLLLALLVGCTGFAGGGAAVTGSGKLVSRSFELTDFSRIDADNAAQVEMTRGDTFSVVVEVDDNVVSLLDVAVTGDTLHIGLQNGSYNDVTLRAQVTMPKLTGVTLDGASRLTGELAGENLVLNLDGATRATLTGTAGQVTIGINGASQALLSGLSADDVNLTADGASRIEVYVTGSVSGTANGASIVAVTGYPIAINVTTDGASQVIKP